MTNPKPSDFISTWTWPWEYGKELAEIMFPPLPLNGSPISDNELRQRINWIQNETEQLKRGLYGEAWNKTVGVLGRLDEIESEIQKTNERIEVMIRYSLYWRAAQTGLLLLIAGMVAGVLLK